MNGILKGDYIDLEKQMWSNQSFNINLIYIEKYLI